MISYKFSLNIFYFITKNRIWQKLYNIMIALSLAKTLKHMWVLHPSCPYKLESVR